VVKTCAIATRRANALPYRLSSCSAIWRHFFATSRNCSLIKESRVCSASSSHSRALARYSSALVVTAHRPVRPVDDERERQKSVPTRMVLNRTRKSPAEAGLNVQIAAPDPDVVPHAVGHEAQGVCFGTAAQGVPNMRNQGGSGLLSRRLFNVCLRGRYVLRGLEDAEGNRPRVY
jgi:hypothetical protein